MNDIIEALQVHMNHLKVNAEANDVGTFKSILQEMAIDAEDAISELDIRAILDE